MIAAVFSLSLGTVDYSCRAQRMELVLPELERLTSLDLAVSQELRDEVVVIDVRNVESDALLERIAFVLRADWHDKNGVRTLERDGARRARNDRDDEQAIKQMIVGEYDAAFPDARKPVPEAALQQLALDLSLVGRLGEREDEARMEWYAIDPLVRSVRPLLDSLDWSVVRRSWGAHAVFSSHPIAFESPLTRTGVRNALQGISNDYDAIKVVCERRGVKTDSDWSTSQWRRAAEIAKEGSATLYFRTGLPYSSVGITVTDGEEWLTQGTGSRSATGLPSKDETGFDPALISEGPFYGDRSKELALFVRNFTKRPSDRLVAELADPLAHDPQSFFETDFLLALKKQLGANLVAAPSELDAITDFTRGTPDGSMRESLPAFLRQHQTKLADGWLVARPKVLAGQEYVQLDRRALAKLVKQLQTENTLQLTDVALAFSPSPSFVYRLLLAYVMAASPSFPINDDYDGAPMEFGSLYRAMSESERRNAAIGGLLVKSLTGRAQDTFRFHLWPVIEAQANHDPDNPRPYHGWMHAVTSPPDDLTVRIKYQEFGTETRALKEGRWKLVPQRSEFDHFFGKDLSKEAGDALFSNVMERDFKGLPIQEASIQRVYFEFSSRAWDRKGEAGFSFPTGVGRSVRSGRSGGSALPTEEVNSRSADGSRVLLR